MLSKTMTSRSFFSLFLVSVLFVRLGGGCLCHIFKNFKCPPPPTCCESGQYTTDECGCCMKCAKAELQTCGGPSDANGKCGSGLQCLKTCLPCTTAGSRGLPCVFPFRYGNHTYERCTPKDSDTGQPWCATSIADDGFVVDGHWGDCLDGCPGTRLECDKKYFSILDGECIDPAVPGAVPNWFGAPAVELLDPTHDLFPAPLCLTKGVARRQYKNSCRCAGGATAVDYGRDGRPRGNCTGLDDDTRDNVAKVFCFLENIRDPQDPFSGCYSDTKWSSRDGRYWSSLACTLAPDVGQRVETDISNTLDRNNRPTSRTPTIRDQQLEQRIRDRLPGPKRRGEARKKKTTTISTTTTTRTTTTPRADTEQDYYSLYQYEDYGDDEVGDYYNYNVDKITHTTEKIEVPEEPEEEYYEDYGFEPTERINIDFDETELPIVNDRVRKELEYGSKFDRSREQDIFDEDYQAGFLPTPAPLSTGNIWSKKSKRKFTPVSTKRRRLTPRPRRKEQPRSSQNHRFNGISAFTTRKPEGGQFPNFRRRPVGGKAETTPAGQRRKPTGRPGKARKRGNYDPRTRRPFLRRTTKRYEEESEEDSFFDLETQSPELYLEGEFGAQNVPIAIPLFSEEIFQKITTEPPTRSTPTPAPNDPAPQSTQKPSIDDEKLRQGSPGTAIRIDIKSLTREVQGKDEEKKQELIQENKEKLIQENKEKVIQENKERKIQENKENLIQENQEKIIQENHEKIIQENHEKIIQENEEKVSVQETQIEVDRKGERQGGEKEKTTSKEQEYVAEEPAPTLNEILTNDEELGHNDNNVDQDEETSLEPGVTERINVFKYLPTVRGVHIVTPLTASPTTTRSESFTTTNHLNTGRNQPTEGSRSIDVTTTKQRRPSTEAETTKKRQPSRETTPNKPKEPSPETTTVKQKQPSQETTTTKPTEPSRVESENEIDLGILGTWSTQPGGLPVFRPQQ